MTEKKRATAKKISNEKIENALKKQIPQKLEFYGDGFDWTEIMIMDALTLILIIAVIVLVVFSF